MEDSSNSGFITEGFQERDCYFSDISEVRRTKHNILLKAKRNGQWWLLKGLLPEESDQPFFQEMLRKESELLLRVQALEHPHIVRTTGLEYIPNSNLINSKFKSNQPFIVMEWVEGQTLSEFLKCNPSQSMKLKVVRELIDVVSCLHSLDIVHRDLKPSNIMVTRNGKNVKLIDFGLADADFAATLKQPSGTERYMSPEQREGSLPDIRNDIYSLGKIFEDMQLGKGWAPVISRCLSPIDRRYHNIGELQEYFRKKERKRLRNIGIAVVCCLLSVAFALYWYAPRPVVQELSDMTTWTYVEPQCFDVKNEGTENTVHFEGEDAFETVHCPIYVKKGHRYRVTVDFSGNGYVPVNTADAGFQVFVREGTPCRARNNSGVAASEVLPFKPVQKKPMSVEFTATEDVMQVRLNFTPMQDHIPYEFHFDDWKLEELSDIAGTDLQELSQILLQNEATGLFVQGGGMFDAQTVLGEEGLKLDLTKCGSGYIVDTHKSDPIDGEAEHYLNYHKNIDGGAPLIFVNAQVWYFIQQEDGCYKLTNDGKLFLTYDGENPVLQMLPNGGNESRNHWRVIKNSQRN